MKIKSIPIFLLLAALILAGCASKTNVFSSEAGKFSVEAPVTLEEQPQTIDVSGGKVDAHTYMGSNDEITYAVAYSDFNEETVNASTLESMLNVTRDSMISGVSGKLILETSVSLGDYSGRELTLQYKPSDGSDGIIKARVYLVKNRLYQVMALVTKGKENDAAITRFLDSFKLLGGQ